MSTRDDAQKDYEAGLKYKEIAEKYDVSESTVKSWASRYWKKDKVATKKRKKSQPLSKRDATNKRGGQKNNLNAAGSSKSHLGQQNALSHGGYSSIYWDTLTDDEKELIETMPQSEEELLIDQLKLLTVNERRLMLAIKKVQYATDKDGNIQDMIVDTAISTESKNYLGKQFEKTINAEHKDNRIIRLQQQLTTVQRAKTKCLDSLFRVHKENDTANKNHIADDWIAAVMGAAKND